MTRNRVVAHSL